MSEQEKNDSLNKLTNFGVVYQDVMKDIKREQEVFWNSLSDEQQLDVFCCVIRRLVKGELDEQGSYRYILYDVFGWGPEAYCTALDAGFMSLHNAIYPDDHTEKMIKLFCKFMNLDVKEDTITKFLRNPYDVT